MGYWGTIYRGLLRKIFKPDDNKSDLERMLAFKYVSIIKDYIT
jgi:hypothetical protein